MDNASRIPSPDDMSFEAAEWNQLRDGMRMSFEAKLDWLEGTLAFAEALRNAPTVPKSRDSQRES